MENKEDLITTQDVFCKSCGTKNEKESKFCFNCGHELKKDENKEEKELLISENNNSKFKLSKESYLVFGLGVLISLLLADDGGLLFLFFCIVCFLLYVRSQKKIYAEDANNKVLEKVETENKGKKKKFYLDRNSILILMLAVVLLFLFIGPIAFVVIFLSICFYAVFSSGPKKIFIIVEKIVSVIVIVMLIMFGTCLIPIFFYS